MNFLTCAVATNPCPPESIESLPFVETIDWVGMGITADAIVAVGGYGFAAVFGAWAIGYGAGIALAAVRKL